jgi:hypothetical protein
MRKTGSGYTLYVFCLFHLLFWTNMYQRIDIYRKTSMILRAIPLV